MKKNTFLGIDKNGQFCCLLMSFLDFDTIKSNLADLSEDDFAHGCTNWNGGDKIERTLNLCKLQLTGRSVWLPHVLEYVGSDYDMGHEYGWTFAVSVIAETNDQHTYPKNIVIPGPRDY